MDSIAEDAQLTNLGDRVINILFHHLDPSILLLVQALRDLQSIRALRYIMVYLTT